MEQHVVLKGCWKMIRSNLVSGIVFRSHMLMYVGIGSPYYHQNPFAAEQADQLPQQGKDEARDERKENEGLTTLLRRLHVFLFSSSPVPVV